MPKGSYRSVPMSATSGFRQHDGGIYVMPAATNDIPDPEITSGTYWVGSGDGFELLTEGIPDGLPVGVATAGQIPEAQNFSTTDGNHVAVTEAVAYAFSGYFMSDAGSVDVTITWYDVTPAQIGDPETVTVSTPGDGFSYRPIGVFTAPTGAVAAKITVAGDSEGTGYAYASCLQFVEETAVTPYFGASRTASSVPMPYAKFPYQNLTMAVRVVPLFDPDETAEKWIMQLIRTGAGTNIGLALSREAAGTIIAQRMTKVCRMADATTWEPGTPHVIAVRYEDLCWLDLTVDGVAATPTEILTGSTTFKAGSLGKYNGGSGQWIVGPMVATSTLKSDEWMTSATADPDVWSDLAKLERFVSSGDLVFPLLNNLDYYVKA